MLLFYGIRLIEAYIWFDSARSWSPKANRLSLIAKFMALSERVEIIRKMCMFLTSVDVLQIDDKRTKQNLIDGNTRHFPVPSEKIPQSPLHHVEIVSNLKDNFKNRFKDFNEIPIVAQFVVSPFMEIDIQQFATSVTQNFSEDIAATETEVIPFQNDLALKSLVSNTECIWPSVRFLEAVSRCEVLSFHIILHIHFSILLHFIW
ncbi:unnamed protein product [Acanthoscelides obtectus]|uniref:Uncharacterized protein n=1 Tax=Acanthoscelides obtectus TaxID=200917 RepID=A0A9P0VP27_ACAOB|nr:unnamed protein product [Acanthoscelides obtectus]CAK1630443.1 hypothetical protein AOBTE_LOCUS6332 [Acanthoscelides obtectus]